MVDLRGNIGGNLVSALSFRARFLDRPRLVGSIRYSDGHGDLTDPIPIRADPAPGRDRHRGPVKFLIDALTYSAAEDAVLGLQGLPNVELVGEASGGGSGRPRLLRLLSDVSLSVSTALTYDRWRRCIEGEGLQPDRRITWSGLTEDEALLAADKHW